MLLNHLFIMSPHPDDLDGLYFLQDLVHEAVLNGDATGISSRKVSDQLFKGWGCLKRIFRENFKQFFGFLSQACCRNFLCVLLSFPGIDNPPLYHPGFSLHFLTGVLSPFRMDSLMPGIDKRYNVS